MQGSGAAGPSPQFEHEGLSSTPPAGVSRPEPAAEPAPTDLVSFLAQLHKSPNLDLLFSSYARLVGEFVPAAVVAIYLLDPASHPVKVVAQGADPKFLSAYEVGGRECDPVFSRVSRRLQTTCNRLILSEAAWESHPFHRVLSVGMLDRIVEAPIVDPEKGLVGTLNFGRSAADPQFDEEEVSTVDRIAQHVSIAVCHAREMTDLRHQELAAEGILEALGTGVMLTDGRGNVQFLNLAARRVFEECETNPALKAAMKNALTQNLAKLDTVQQATQLVQLPRRSLNRSAYLTVHSTRLSRESDLVITFWYQPNQDPSFEHLRGVLTAQEIRVLELLAQGLENKQIAEYLAVSIDTVKSHLKRVFSKMHVASRSQLLSQLFYRT